MMEILKSFRQAYFLLWFGFIMFMFSVIIIYSGLALASSESQDEFLTDEENFIIADGLPEEKIEDPSSTIDPDRTIETGNISLNVKEADIRDVLTIIAIKTNTNIAYTEEPEEVTLKLENVPPREALELLVEMVGQKYIEDGNIIVVGSSERLEGDFFNRLELSRFDFDYVTADQVIGLIEELDMPVQTTKLDANPKAIWAQGTTPDLVKMKKLVDSVDKSENRLAMEDKDIDKFQYMEIAPENLSPEKVVMVLEEAGIEIDGYIALEDKLVIFDENILEDWTNFEKLVKSFDEEGTEEKFDLEKSVVEYEEVSTDFISPERLSDLMEEIDKEIDNYLVLGNRLLIFDEDIIEDIDNFKEFVADIDSLETREKTSFRYTFDNLTAADAIEKFEAYDFDEVEIISFEPTEFNNEIIVVTPPHKEDEIYNSLADLDVSRSSTRVPITTARGENARDRLVAKRRLLSEMSDVATADMNISDNISGDDSEPHYVLWADKPSDKILELQNLVESFDYE